MGEIEEFRLVLEWRTDEATQQKKWHACIRQSPIAEHVGMVQPLESQFPRTILSMYQNATEWQADPANVTQAGHKAWQAIIPDMIRDALNAALFSVARAENRLRIRIVIPQRRDIPPPPPGMARLDEVPLELLCDPKSPLNPNGSSEDDFLCLRNSPVCLLSRQPMEGTVRRSGTDLVLPLKILVVTSQPAGYPYAEMQREQESLKKVLQQLEEENRVMTRYLPDRERKLEADTDAFAADVVQFQPDIIHFIGHGTVAPQGGTNEPALLFVKRGSKQKTPEPFSASQMLGVVGLNSVRLLVLTACSTAQIPNAINQTTPQTGFAQRLVAGKNAPAVIAMQFPLDGHTATSFTRDFYYALLVHGKEVDEALAIARRVLIAQSIGNRAWVCPTLFWRQERGDFLRIVGGHPLPPQSAPQPTAPPVISPPSEIPIVGRALTPEEKNGVNTLMEELTDTEWGLADLARQNDDYQMDARYILCALVEKDRIARAELCRLHPDHIFLKGGAFVRDASIPLSLNLQTEQPGRIDAVEFEINFPPDIFEYRYTQLSHANEIRVENIGPGRVRVWWRPENFQDSSPAGSTSLGKIIFRAAPNRPEAAAPIHLTAAQLTRQFAADDGTWQTQIVPLAPLTAFVGQYFRDALSPLPTSS